MTFIQNCAAALFGVLCAPAALAGTLNLEVEVRSDRLQQGTIYAALFDEAGFEGGAPVASLTAPMADASVRIAFEGVAPGRYGVKLFLDTDGDGKRDTGLFGRPTEPFGFSNDAPIRMGPPRWKDAAVDVSATTPPVVINLR